MNPNNTIVVVSTYKTPVPWVDRLKEKGFEVRVYTKETPSSPYDIPKNIGNEGSVYLKYIIDNYNCLPEYSIFLHDHEVSYHQEGSILDAIDARIGSHDPFWNFNIPSDCEFYMDQPDGLIDLYNRFLKSYCGDLYQYGEFVLGRKLYAQFLVHSSCILKRPKRLYEEIYTWLMTEPVNRFISGFFLEVFWDLIFGQIEPQPFFPIMFVMTNDSMPNKEPLYYAEQSILFGLLTDPIPTDCHFILYYDSSIKHINILHIYGLLKYYNLLQGTFRLTLSGDPDGLFFSIRSASNTNEQRRLVINEPDIANAPFLGNHVAQRENRSKKIHPIYDSYGAYCS